MKFYMKYACQWSEYYRSSISIGDKLVGYCMGRSEGYKHEYHGHISVLTVEPSYRRNGIAYELMNDFENITNIKKGYFVDLFVRASNINAIKFYKKLGYVLYRTVMQYYRHGIKKEDGLDMRKCMKIDKNKVSLICKKNKIKPSQIVWKRF